MLHGPSAPLWRRLGWFALIWLASVLSISFVATIIRFWLQV